LQKSSSRVWEKPRRFRPKINSMPSVQLQARWPRSIRIWIPSRRGCTRAAFRNKRLATTLYKCS
jgi:hypothetical protein